MLSLFLLLFPVACTQDIVAFLLSPEARELRPLLLAELVEGVDLLARDQLRRAYTSLPALLTPRLPLLGPLPLPALPAPPVLVPGVGFMPAAGFVEAVAPPLSQPEAVYLQSLRQMSVSMFGEGTLLCSCLLPQKLRLFSACMKWRLCVQVEDFALFG